MENSARGPWTRSSPDVASCTYSPTSANPSDGISATYSGDDSYQGSSSPSALSQEVDQDGTSTALDVSPGSPVVGESVTLTATVSANAPGSGTPTGTVTFMGNDGTLCSGPVTLSGGSASCSVSYPAVTTDNFTADYSGDSNFDTSSASSSVSVGQDTTSTTASASPSSSVVGQTVTLSATVAVDAPGAGTPTGTVDFSDAGGDLCMGTLNASSPDVASCTYVPSATTSADAITADYGGDANDNASSGSTSESVAPDSTTTVLGATASPVVGQSVTYTATVAAVSPGSGTPTGTVTFTQGATTLCAAVALSQSSPDTATCSTSYPAPTTVNVTAAYSGDANDNASSGAKSVTVVKDATVQGLTSTANPSVTGQQFIVTDSLSAAAPGAGTPTGTVTFSFSTPGATPSCQGADTVVIASAKATCILSGLNPSQSQLSVSANYHGDTNFDAGTAATPLVETIHAANPAFAITSSANPVVTGDAVTLNATISAAAPGSTSGATPTGTPTWAITGHGGVTVNCTSTSTGTSGTNETATCAVAAGQLVFSGTPYVVKVSYPGDANFNAGVGTFQENVTLGTSAVAVHIVRPTSNGGTATITATVSGQPASLGTPTGTLNFVITDKSGNAVELRRGDQQLQLVLRHGHVHDRGAQSHRLDLPRLRHLRRQRLVLPQHLEDQDDQGARLRPRPPEATTP